jgi:hypothetical protein
MNTNKNTNFFSILSLLALAALITLISFLLSGVFSNVSNNNSQKIDNTTKSIEVPTTFPEFNMELLTKDSAPACPISDNQVDYISKTNANARLKIIDISKPFKEGYPSTNIEYLKNYLNNNQTWNLTDGSNIIKLWGYACEGINSKEIQDTTKETELNFANVMKSKSLFALDTVSNLNPVDPRFYAVAMRGNYAMILSVQSPELNSKLPEFITKCTTAGVLDQSCYEKIILLDDNKTLLYNSAIKAITEFSF